jgi:hypothetical protein
MNRMTVKARVGPDGVLNVTVPLGAAEPNQEVEVTIEPLPPTMTQEEWHNWVLSMAGSIKDPTFIRHEQGEYEQREGM